MAGQLQNLAISPISRRRLEHDVAKCGVSMNTNSGARSAQVEMAPCVCVLHRSRHRSLLSDGQCVNPGRFFVAHICHEEAVAAAHLSTGRGMQVDIEVAITFAVELQTPAFFD